MSDENIESVRKCVLEHFDSQPNTVYYEEDLIKLKNDDWFIHRFIRSKQEDKVKNVIKDSTEAVINCIKFRKSNQIYDIMKGNGFPIELVTNGPLQIDEGELTVVSMV